MDSEAWGTVTVADSDQGAQIANFEPKDSVEPRSLELMDSSQESSMSVHSIRAPSSSLNWPPNCAIAACITSKERSGDNEHALMVMCVFVKMNGGLILWSTNPQIGQQNLDTPAGCKTADYKQNQKIWAAHDYKITHIWKSMMFGAVGGYASLSMHWALETKACI